MRSAQTFVWHRGDDGVVGYFSLAELMANRGKLGLEIERDLFFTPCRLSALHPALTG